MILLMILVEEKGSDAAIALLIEYRDNNIDHLPAHQHLLEFLQRECQEDEHVLVKKAFKCCLDRFPFSQNYVLRYCEMLIKLNEDADLDDSMGVDQIEEDLSDDDDKSDIEEKASHKRILVNQEIVTVAVNCLDYKTSSNNLTLWTYLAESLKQLCSNDPEASQFAQNLFSSRLGWWSKQNSNKIDQIDDQLLVKKAVIYLILFGAENEEYDKLLKALDERRRKSASSLFCNLMKELEMFQLKASGALLAPYRRELLQDYEFIRDEWKKIKAMKVESQANDPRSKTQYSSRLSCLPVPDSPKAVNSIRRGCGPKKKKPQRPKKPPGRPKKRPHWREVHRQKEVAEAAKKVNEEDKDDDIDNVHQQEDDSD